MSNKLKPLAFLCLCFLSGCTQTASKDQSIKYKAATNSKYVYKQPAYGSHTFTVEFKNTPILLLIDDLDSPYRYDTDIGSKSINFNIGTHILSFENGTDLIIKISNSGQYALSGSNILGYKIEKIDTGEVIIDAAVKKQRSYGNSDYSHTPTYVGHGKWY
jgi:hypothetical protein